MTQDAARDAPFRQEISHTGLRQHQQFRKFNREKLDKIEAWPLGARPRYRRNGHHIARAGRPPGLPGKITRGSGHLTNAIRQSRG